MVIALGVLGLGDDDAAHLVAEHRFTDFHLPLIALVALGHDDLVAARRGLALDAVED